MYTVGLDVLNYILSLNSIKGNYLFIFGIRSISSASSYKFTEMEIKQVIFGCLLVKRNYS